MVVEKILNNNVIVSTDPRTKKEVILMGCGIAFKKKIGEIVDKEKVEKVFVVDNETMGNKIKNLINQIPDGIFELAHEIITYANKELQTKMDKQIYISLSDHIAFALKRYKRDIQIKNDLLYEIRRIHKDEYRVARKTVNYINKRLKVNLPEDEAGFIALHFVNASYNETSTEVITSTSIINGVLDVIRNFYSIEFNEDDLSYDRLLTHLKYFAIRVIRNSNNNNGKDNFIEVASKSYPKAYECTLRVKEHIITNYSYSLSDDEIVYLTMHIHRVTSVLKDNNLN